VNMLIEHFTWLVIVHKGPDGNRTRVCLDEGSAALTN
jgi:hypothetical protein